MRNILLGLSAFIALGVSIFALQALSYGSFKFWAPKYENAKREVFENTKSYKHGTIRDLQNLMLEYKSSDNEGHRAALRATILHRSVSIDQDKLTPQLRKFLNNI